MAISFRVSKCVLHTCSATYRKGRQQDQADQRKAVDEGTEPLSTGSARTCCRILGKGLKQQLRDSNPCVRSNEESDKEMEAVPKQPGWLPNVPSQSDNLVGPLDEECDKEMEAVPKQPGWLPSAPSQSDNLVALVVLVQQLQDNTVAKMHALNSRLSQVEWKVDRVDDGILNLKKVIKEIDAEADKMKACIKSTQDDLVGNVNDLLSNLLSVRDDVMDEWTSMHAECNADPAPKAVQSSTDKCADVFLHEQIGSSLLLGPSIRSRVEWFESGALGSCTSTLTKTSPLSSGVGLYDLTLDDGAEEEEQFFPTGDLYEIVD